MFSACWCYRTQLVVIIPIWGPWGRGRGSSPGPKGKGEAPREGKRTGRFGGREADYRESQELEPRSVADEALTGFSATVGRPVKTAPENRLVITHGTGTMELTAKALDGNVGQKTVVLTGAMRPWCIGRSDGNFNLGGAITAVSYWPVTK